MKRRILIISPHFPPSNLAAVHRSRLFAQHLPDFEWEPLILTVQEKYYEEPPDWNLVSLLPRELRIEKVRAFPVTRPRLIGDIGLRAFFQLYRKAWSLIKEEKIDFLYIPIPSFYVALLGRWLHATTGIQYGIDYIDPWVHKFPGSDRTFSRHWFSMKLSAVLEPIAVKRASLITGVAEGYYAGVRERNPNLEKTCLFGSMPYGGEEQDHIKVKELGLKAYLFRKTTAARHQLVYAGAMLPKAYRPLEALMQAISRDPASFSNLEIHFIGSGKTANDAEGYNIRPLAEKYGLWGNVFFEHPTRIPYLDVLAHLNAATGVFILGSTEPHYTPSKVYQAVLSKKPVLAILHAQSTACKVIRMTHAGIVLEFAGERGIAGITENFDSVFHEYIQFASGFQPVNANDAVFQQFSAKAVTKSLTKMLGSVK